MPQFRHFDVRQTDGCTELHLADTTYYDVTQFAEIQQELLSFVDACRPQKLVVNFDRIRYCSTALITGVVQARKGLQLFGGELKLCGMSGPVREAFGRLNLDGAVFEIHELESEAIAAF